MTAPWPFEHPIAAGVVNGIWRLQKMPIALLRRQGKNEGGCKRAVAKKNLNGEVHAPENSTSTGSWMAHACEYRQGRSLDSVGKSSTRASGLLGGTGGCGLCAVA